MKAILNIKNEVNSVIDLTNKNLKVMQESSCTMQNSLNDCFEMPDGTEAPSAKAAAAEAPDAKAAEAPAQLSTLLQTLSAGPKASPQLPARLTAAGREVQRPEKTRTISND